MSPGDLAQIRVIVDAEKWKRHNEREVHREQNIRDKNWFYLPNSRTPTGNFHTQNTVNRFGPCAPSTRMRSMSPVREGPVMKLALEGHAAPYFSCSR